MTELAGVVPIAVTPFDARGRVDEESIATLVEFEARCGVHALDDVTRAELTDILTRLGLLAR